MATIDTRWDAAKGRLSEAADKADVDPGIMAKIAGFESKYNPHIKAPGSSAYGYGQFTNDTWVDMIHKYGEKYGVDNAERMPRGQALSAAIRDNPDLQMAMLAEHTRDNVALGTKLGGRDADANVYALHNLGGGDGPKFLNALRDNPDQSVADVFTGKHGAKVISNNPSLYLNHGKPVTVGEAYARMGKLMDQYEKYAVEARGGRREQGQAEDQQLTPPTQGRQERKQADALADGMLQQGEKGPDVKGLQESLNTLGVKDANGNRLAQDSTYGKHTKEAVENFQRANGLKVDGIAGKDTLSAIGNKLPEGKVTVDASGVTGPDAKIIAQDKPVSDKPDTDKPLISDAKHPNHALFEAISAKLPAGTKPEVAANITLQALENGITGPDKLARVDISGSDAFVQGNVAGDRAKVDLTAPTPTLQQMSDHMAQQSQRAQQQQPPLEQQRTQILQ